MCIIATVLFILECYHVIGHMAILCRVRLLPRKDLVRIRYYFLIDASTVFIINFLYIGQLKWLATLQIIQHMYYFITWDKSFAAKKIIDWSSLDWFSSHKNGRLELDSILGTAFDVGVHLINSYLLAQYMSVIEIILALLISHSVAGCLLFSTRFAWSHPKSMPKWVHKRIQPLTKVE